MGVADLTSVVIPARNEVGLWRTVENLRETAAGPLQLIVVLDGYDLEPNARTDQKTVDEFKRQIDQVHSLSFNDSSVVVKQYNKAVGQRVAINAAVKEFAQGEYFCKTDAHCQMMPGWDLQLKEAAQPGIFVTPAMYSLEPATWKMGTRVLDFARLDWDLATRWWLAYQSREYRRVAETMSFWGTTWFLRTEFWNELGGYYDNFSGWGQSGSEFALKVWLRGYRMMIHRGVWCAHVYRDKWHYPPPGSANKRTAKALRNMYLQNLDPLQVHPVEWLIGKFWPVPEWPRTLLQPAERRRFEGR